jgi:hypothetical protein
MNKIFRDIIFGIVLVIIMLHTVIPHPHSGELTKEEHFELHKKSNSLFGIIRLIFHESDDDNLDNLMIAKYESFKKLYLNQNYPTALIFKNITSPLEKIETKKTIKSNTFNFNKLLFVKPNGLRGPPILTNIFGI